MPLPVAHGVLGATVVAALQPSHALNRHWKALLLGAFLAACPDFDYFLNLIPGLGGGWHHGFTHSLVFAFLLGFSTSLCLGELRFKEVMMYSLATVSHPLLDFFITESRGIELFWPFSNLRFKLRIPNPIDYSWGSTSLWETLLDLLRISLIELMIFAPILIIVLWIKQINRRHDISV